MLRRAVDALVLAMTAMTALVVLAAPAHAAPANAVSGPCVGTGTWEKAGFTEDSTKHNQGDTITVPQKDTVHWFGSEKGGQLGVDGPRRAINGSVQLDLPLGTVTIDDWSNPPNGSTAYANEGEHKYDLPPILIGVKMKLHGSHSDDGAVTCSGSVYVKVAGSATKNPLFWVGLGLSILAGGVLVFAGRPVFTKVRPTYDDIH